MAKRELKKFKLASSNRPGTNKLLSEVVAIRVQQQHYYCYVRFSGDLVNHVGRILPQGVSAATPAFLTATQEAEGGAWSVYVAYWGEGKDNRYYKLWETASTPTWVKLHTIKRGKNGRSETPR